MTAVLVYSGISSFRVNTTVPRAYVLSFMGSCIEHVNKPNFKKTSPSRLAGLTGGEEKLDNVGEGK